LVVEEFGTLHIGEEIGRGKHGTVFSVENAPFVVKLIRDPNHTVCNEQASFTSLEGLEGFVPRTFRITNGLSSSCMQRVIVMERMGDVTWHAGVLKFDKSFYLRFARLIEGVKLLHEKGFVHRNLSSRNVMVRHADPVFVAMIDFGSAMPWIEGETEFLSRQNDMIQLCEMVELIAISEWYPDWLGGMMEEMAGLGPTDRPDYEKWITFFTENSLEDDIVENRFVSMARWMLGCYVWW
jgi:serine/threonine protein kinase